MARKARLRRQVEAGSRAAADAVIEAEGAVADTTRVANTIDEGKEHDPAGPPTTATAADQGQALRGVTGVAPRAVGYTRIGGGLCTMATASNAAANNIPSIPRIQASWFPIVARTASLPPADPDAPVSGVRRRRRTEPAPN